MNHPLATVELVSAVQPLLDYISLAIIYVHDFEVHRERERERERERVRSTYVHSAVNKNFVYPERFVNKGLIY